MSNSWSKKASDDRIAAFVKEYEALCLKHGVELMAAPQFVPSGQHGFNVSAFIQPVDKKSLPVPSDPSIL